MTHSEHQLGTVIRKYRKERGYMAGIYRIINGTPEFTILTREPADCIRHIHDRMPVILPQGISKDWLNVHFRANEVLRSSDLNMEHTPEITAFA